MKKEDIYIMVNGFKMSKCNYLLYLDSIEDGVMLLALEPLVSFVPNWKRIGLKSKKEGLKHVIDFIKAEEKHLSDRGYGKGILLDGNLNTLVDLKGSPKLKRKKDFIQA